MKRWEPFHYAIPLAEGEVPMDKGGFRTVVEKPVSSSLEAIVWCKDCKWWGTDRMCENSDSPCFQNGCTHGNWFCADGERKSD